MFEYGKVIPHDIFGRNPCGVICPYIYPYHEVTPSNDPLSFDMNRITIDGLMINLDYIPTDMTEAFAKVFLCTPMANLH